MGDVVEREVHWYGRDQKRERRGIVKGRKKKPGKTKIINNNTSIITLERVGLARYLGSQAD